MRRAETDDLLCNALEAMRAPNRAPQCAVIARIHTTATTPRAECSRDRRVHCRGAPERRTTTRSRHARQRSTGEA